MTSQTTASVLTIRAAAYHGIVLQGEAQQLCCVNDVREPIAPTSIKVRASRKHVRDVQELSVVCRACRKTALKEMQHNSAVQRQRSGDRAVPRSSEVNAPPKATMRSTAQRPTPRVPAMDRMQYMLRRIADDHALMISWSSL